MIGFLIAFFLISPTEAKTPKSNKSAPAVAYQRALQLEKSSRYEEAIPSLEELERTYPYSSYARKAKLKIADIHFKMRNFLQAHYQYKHYYDMYPKEADSDYALYRSGFSQFKELPKTIDRDLSLSSEVLKNWRYLLVKFPNTKYTKKVLENQKKLLHMLGEKELYIASFYLKNRKYISAQGRFNRLFARHPTFRKNKKAVTKALKCAKKLNDEFNIKLYSRLLSEIQKP